MLWPHGISIFCDQLRSWTSDVLSYKRLCNKCQKTQRHRKGFDSWSKYAILWLETYSDKTLLSFPEHCTLKLNYLTKINFRKGSGTFLFTNSFEFAQFSIYSIRLSTNWTNIPCWALCFFSYDWHKFKEIQRLFVIKYFHHFIFFIVQCIMCWECFMTASSLHTCSV